VIGRYLVEQVRFHMFGFVPELMGAAVQNDDGISGEHLYVPRFNHADGKKRDYLRGFGMQMWGSGAQANASFAKSLDGFGADFKKNVKRRYPALVALHPYGEVLPYRDNRVTVEGTALDQYGVPVVKIDYKVRENEHKMIAEMYDAAESILRSAKAEILPFRRGHLDHAGSAIHEHGTVRMGRDPKRSALNGFCQMHEVKNVFVVDGAAFPTATEKNPTLTILALAWRATDYLAEQVKRGEI
jgi:choline dehydrogenase-like flavoprotein